MQLSFEGIFPFFAAISAFMILMIGVGSITSSFLQQLTVGKTFAIAPELEEISPSVITHSLPRKEDTWLVTSHS